MSNEKGVIKMLIAAKEATVKELQALEKKEEAKGDYATAATYCFIIHSLLLELQQLKSIVK